MTSLIPLNINWHEGMLLSQHHFQQNDSRIFHTISFQMDSISHNNYGIKHIEHDKNALNNGIYRIEELEAIFPDGLIITYYPKLQKGLKPIEININNCIINNNSILIYLAIAKSLHNISPIIGEYTRFYEIETESVKDNNLDTNEISIPRLFPNAFLYSGEALPEFCIGFPICLINANNSIYSVSDWTYPCLYIEANSKLHNLCVELVKLLRDKLTINDTNTEIQRILFNIKLIMPTLEAMLYSNNLKPYDLYIELTRILGAVSIVKPDKILPSIIPYNHDDIDSCIYPLIKLINEYISYIDKDYIILHFNKKDRFFYKYLTIGDIENIKNNKNKIYIGIKGEKLTTINDIEIWLKEAIIVSDFALDQVRTKRIQGASRNILDKNMAVKLIPSSGTVLFEIDLDNRYIREEQNLHIFNPGNSSDFTPSDIVLYLPKNEVQ
ncbi:MAG: type VI secretion system baseplate subunit TssK [Alphaproteobacteria bacterium]|nr:type VI secretion system baseplate subunit TssK [Alphaproteobacteria bacterium]